MGYAGAGNIMFSLEHCAWKHHSGASHPPP